MTTETISNRKQTAFRLNEKLLNHLRTAAKRENRSLNNYVESVLMDVVFRSPNKITLAAMQEAKNSENLHTLDLDNFENFVASL